MAVRRSPSLSGKQHAALAALLAVCLTVTAMAWRHQRDMGIEQANARFDRQLAIIQTALIERMQGVVDLVVAARALTATGPVTAERWRAFVGSLDLDHRLGVDGLGYIAAVRGEAKGEFESRMRRERPNFAVVPPGSRTVYYVLSHIEPGRNTTVIGLDLATFPSRRAAAEQARDEDAPILSEKVRLVTPAGAENDLVVFLPVYAPGATPHTVEERRRALIGWVAAGLHAQALLDGLGGPDPSIHMHVFDGPPVPAESLYESTLPDPSGGGLERERTIPLLGREWTVRFHTGAAFHRDGDDRTALLMLLAGLTSTICLWWGAFSLMAARARGVAMAMALTEEVRTSRRRYRSIVTTTQQGYWEIDGQGMTTDVNPALCTMLKAERAGLVGRSALDWVAPHHRHLLERHLARRATTPQSQVEIDLVRGDGMIVHAQLQATTLFGRDGGVATSFAMVADVTHLRRAESALKESERRYRGLVENIQDGLMIIVDGRLRFVNEPFARMVGHRADALIGTDFRALVAPEDRRMVEERYRLRLAGLDVPQEYCCRLLWRAGSERVIALLHTAVIEEADGAPATVGTVKDVTAQRRGDEQLRLLWHAVENSPVSVMVTDAEGRILYVNPGFVAMTGYGSAEVAGRTPRLLKSDQTPPEAHTAMWQSVLSGQRWSGIFRDRRKDGAVVALATSISPIQDDNGVITHLLAVQSPLATAEA